MNSSIYRFTLDMHKTQSQASIPATLGDTGRELHIRFTDGGNPYTIETGCLAKLTIKRPTGTTLEEFCEIRDNTTVVYPFSQNENTCAVEGINECDVTLFGIDGRKITSPRFSLIVSNSVLRSDDIVITDETLSIITSIVSSEALRRDAESKRAEAEATRRDAEPKRVEAETLRQDAESERVEAEALRQEAESERMAAEALRQEAESERVEAEATRQEAESKRDERIANLESQIEDILYEPISISSFTHNAGTQERGAIITDITLSWQTNKTPTTLTLDNEVIDVNTNSKVISGLSIGWDNNKTWTLKATDARDAVATKTTSITFCSGIYYGVGNKEGSFDSAFVTSLSKKLQTSKAYDFTVNPTAQYIYYAVPKRLGTVSFKVGGFEGGFEAPETVSVTNSSNYTEDYYVYRSTNKITGSTTVDVT